MSNLGFVIDIDVDELDELVNALVRAMTPVVRYRNNETAMAIEAIGISRWEAKSALKVLQKHMPAESTRYQFIEQALAEYDGLRSDEE